MKFQTPRRREPGLRAGDVLRAPQEPIGPEKPRITPDLASILSSVSPFSHGETATITGEALTLLPEDQGMRFTLASVAAEVRSLAEADPANIKRDLLSFEKLSAEPAKTLLAIALLSRDLPAEETKTLAKTCWGYAKTNTTTLAEATIAILGAKILLPEIQAFQQEILDSFQPADARYEYSPEMLNVEGLYTRALIKLIAPEWADQLALSAEANEKIIKEINRLKAISGPTAANMIFGLSILNHPDVHLVPGVGLDFHPVDRTIGQSTPLPERDGV